jgi:hypothetical protein
MLTKHCVRWSMSLCPKQAKGVTGVQGTVRAEPLQLVNGSEKLTLRFDCKPCEMQVVGKMKRSVMNQRAREMAEGADPVLSDAAGKAVIPGLTRDPSRRATMDAPGSGPGQAPQVRQ